MKRKKSSNGIRHLLEIWRIGLTKEKIDHWRHRSVRNEIPERGISADDRLRYANKSLAHRASRISRIDNARYGRARHGRDDCGWLTARQGRARALSHGRAPSNCRVGYDGRCDRDRGHDHDHGHARPLDAHSPSLPYYLFGVCVCECVSVWVCVRVEMVRLTFGLRPRPRPRSKAKINV